MLGSISTENQCLLVHSNCLLGLWFYILCDLHQVTGLSKSGTLKKQVASIETVNKHIT
uniref:Uncharacterized protein n=1 Tax=Arion vulgaris TaxID=1028688 RepID=A0A0B7AF70_9EUPU